MPISIAHAIEIRIVTKRKVHFGARARVVLHIDHRESVLFGLAIFPIQDWLAIDEHLRRSDFENERINDPANPHHHWRYRLHLNVEELLTDKASDLRAQIEGLLKDSNRYCQSPSR